MVRAGLKVAIVVDPQYGARLDLLARTHHVWAVHSSANTPVAEALWRSHGPGAEDIDIQVPGITIFNASPDASPADVCAEIADVVDEHHGEPSATPPWSEIEVIGTDLTESLQEIFEHLGTMQFEPLRGGFRVRRADDARQT